MQNARRALFLAALMVLFAGLLTACGGGGSSSSSSEESTTATTEENGGEETTGGEESSEGGGEPYKIGHITTFNPAVAAPSEYYKGLEAYFKDLNANGGVNGKEVELEVFDDELNPQKAVAGFNQMAENGDLAVTGLTISSTIPGISAAANRAEVPVVLGASPTSAATDPVTPWVFSFAEVFSDTLSVMTDFTAEKSLGKKVATLYFEGPESEKGAEFAEKYLPEKGLELATSQYLPAEADADYSKQINAVKSSGAEVIFIIHSPSAIISVKKAMDAAGIDIPVISNPSGLTKEVFEAMGSTPYYGVSAWAPDESAPGWAEFSEASKKYGDSKLFGDQDSSYVGGYIGGILLTKVLEKCGAECDRDGFKEAMDELNASEAELGGLSDTVEMSEEDHQGPTAAMVFEEKGGKLVPASKFIPYSSEAG
jgi:branched-chain amino acid transport system substrate-binding protein